MRFFFKKSLHSTSGERRSYHTSMSCKFLDSVLSFVTFLCGMCALAPDTLGVRSRSNGSGSSNNCSKTYPGVEFQAYKKE